MPCISALFVGTPYPQSRLKQMNLMTMRFLMLPAHPQYQGHSLLISGPPTGYGACWAPNVQKLTHHFETHTWMSSPRFWFSRSQHLWYDLRQSLALPLQDKRFNNKNPSGISFNGLCIFIYIPLCMYVYIYKLNTGAT